MPLRRTPALSGHTARAMIRGIGLPPARAPTKRPSVSTISIPAMASRFTPGDTVQTRFGKGVVREVRNRDLLLVDVQGLLLVVTASEISPLGPARKLPRVAAPQSGSHHNRPTRGTRTVSAEVDLHGLTVAEALDRAQHALSEALLADLSELRFIHGRGGGRIRAALHRLLGENSSVRKFRLDPRNEGVTIVTL